MYGFIQLEWIYAVLGDGRKRFSAITMHDRKASVFEWSPGDVSWIVSSRAGDVIAEGKCKSVRTAFVASALCSSSIFLN